MLFFFFNDTATTEIYTLSLHDALPISSTSTVCAAVPLMSAAARTVARRPRASIDRKSTRLNSSHDQISYAVFCLKKKKKHSRATTRHNSQVIDDVVHQSILSYIPCLMF